MLIMGLSLQRGGALGASNQPSFPESMDGSKGFTLGLSLASMPPPPPAHTLTPSYGTLGVGDNGWC